MFLWNQMTFLVLQSTKILKSFFESLSLHCWLHLETLESVFGRYSCCLNFVPLSCGLALLSFINAFTSISEGMNLSIWTWWALTKAHRKILSIQLFFFVNKKDYKKLEVKTDLFCYALPTSVFFAQLHIICFNLARYYVEKKTRASGAYKPTKPGGLKQNRSVLKSATLLEYNKWCGTLIKHVQNILT